MSCPRCPHCQDIEAAAKAKARKRPAVAKRDSIEKLVARVGYGTDGRSTAVVDWYDGWGDGIREDVLEEPLVPERIIDVQAYREGWAEGWKDSERSRRWRLAHAHSSDGEGQ